MKWNSTSIPRPKHAAKADATSTPRGRFGVAFAGLVRDHRYDLNTIGSLLTSPQALAFFDFRLAFMSYHMLVMALRLTQPRALPLTRLLLAPPRRRPGQASDTEPNDVQSL